MPTQTEEQKRAAFAAAGLNLPQQAAVTAGMPSPISVSGLQNPTQPFQIQQPQVPPVPPPTYQPQAPVEQDPLKGLEESIAAQFDPAKKTAQAGLAAAQPFQDQLNQVNAQIVASQANQVAAQERVRQSGGDVYFQSGEEARVNRNAAIDQWRLSAQALALQGNITGAQNAAKIAVDAEFAEQTQRLETLRQNIVNNYDTFSTAQKKRADAALLKLDKDDAFVAQQKEDRTAIDQIKLIAVKNGAPSELYSKSIGSVDEALDTFAGFLENPTEAAIKSETLRGLRLKNQELESNLSGEGGVPKEVISWANNLTSGRVKLSDIPQADRADVLNYLSATGQKLPRELNPTQQQAANNAADGLTSLSTLITNVMDGDIVNGKIDREELRKATLVPYGIGARSTYTAVKNIADVVTRVRTGAALNQSEEAFYKEQSPNWKDDDATLRQKTNQLAAFYAGMSGTPVTLQAPDGTQYVYDDLFDQRQRTEVRQAISSGYSVVNF